MFGVNVFNHGHLLFNADPYPDYTEHPPEAEDPCDSDFMLLPQPKSQDGGQAPHPNGITYRDYKISSHPLRTFTSGWYDDSGDLITTSDMQNDSYGTYHMGFHLSLKWLAANEIGKTYTTKETYDEFCGTSGRSDGDSLRQTSEGYWTNSPEGYTGKMAIITRMSDYEENNTTKIYWTDPTKGLQSNDGVAYNVHHCGLLPLFCESKRRKVAGTDPTGYWIDKTTCLPNTVMQGHNNGLCSDVCEDGYVKNGDGICVQSDDTIESPNYLLFGGIGVAVLIGFVVMK